jgi:acyl-CoA synthetase (NDP forming)
MDPDRRKIFDKIFFPESVAIVGMSRKSIGLGGQYFLGNLQRAGYPGRIYLINPTASEINGMPAYPNISALPEAVDLSILCIPAQFVPSLMEECSRKGVRNVYILSSGFKELGTPEGIQLEEEIQRQAEKGQLNVIGPNCMGPYVPKSRLMLWGQIPATPGSFAFLSQSGGLTQRMSEHAHFTGMGISKAVSFGNAAYLDSTDYLEYLEEDEETRVIGLYLEGVRDGRRFLEVARRINRTKPLVLWKGGETPSGAGTIASHTGSLSGEEKIWENGLRQACVSRARSLEEVAGTAMTFLYLPPARGRRVFILGGGGGNSVYYADICMRLGLQIPPLAGRTLEEVSPLVPSVGSFARNPVDSWRAFYDANYLGQILDPVFEDPDLDLIILDRLISRPTYATPEQKDATPAAIEYLRKNISRKPLVVVVDGSGEDPSLAAEAARIRQLFCQAGIPAYPSLPLAAQALAHLAAYHEKKWPSTDNDQRRP